MFTFFSLWNEAAVSCSPIRYRLGAGGIGVGVDGQAGPCMGGCMDECMGRCMWGWMDGWMHGGGVLRNRTTRYWCYEFIKFYCNFTIQRSFKNVGKYYRRINPNSPSRGGLEVEHRSIFHTWTALLPRWVRIPLGACYWPLLLLISCYMAPLPTVVCYPMTDLD